MSAIPAAVEILSDAFDMSDEELDILAASLDGEATETPAEIDFARKSKYRGSLLRLLDMKNTPRGAILGQEDNVITVKFAS